MKGQARSFCEDLEFAHTDKLKQILHFVYPTDAVAPIGPQTRSIRDDKPGWFMVVWVGQVRTDWKTFSFRRSQNRDQRHPFCADLSGLKIESIAFPSCCARIGTLFVRIAILKL